MVAALSNGTASSALSSKVSSPNPKRQPLLPSESRNNASPSRRPKAKEVTSRYLSSSTATATTSSSSSSSNTSSSYSSSARSISSRRNQSPSVMRTGMAAATTPARSLSTPKRSQSVDRQRPSTPLATPVSAADVSSATRLLVTSKRSLSVSFQGESFSLPVSKAKPAPTPVVTGNLSSSRKGTPERRKVATPAKDQTDNSRITDQHRWPGRTKPVSSSILTKSLDYGTDKLKLSGSLSVIRGLQRSMIDENGKTNKEAKLRDESQNVELRNKLELGDDANSASASVSTKSADAAGSDSDSVSSESTSGGSVIQVRGGRRGIVVLARFWQETNSKLRKGAELAAVSPVSLKNNGVKAVAPPKRIGGREFVNESPGSSPKGGVSVTRGFPSPLRGAVRPASPSKSLISPVNSPGRGMPSPTRTRNGVVSLLSRNVCDTPSVLSFAADVRRGKVGQNQASDAHELRLLYNHHLQWRFANTRAESALSSRAATAERSLYNAWVTTSKLRHSVKSKRIQLQLKRQNLKLVSVLKGEVPYLESWDLMDPEHCSSLTGAREALESSIVRLPLVGGARADMQQLNNAICSAADVMGAMASSVCSQLAKVEQVNLLASELGNIIADERALLDQCKDLLSSLTAMQVNDCSLRTHILQQKAQVIKRSTSV